MLQRHLSVAVVGAGLLSVLAAGSVSALHLRSDGAPALAAATALETRVQPGPRADRERTVVPEDAVRPSPVETTPVAVSPLGDLRTPDVVVRSASPLTPELVGRLRTLPGVTASALVDTGAVTVAGAPARVLGVDPSEVRAFTPQETAASDALTQAVARGDLAVSYAVQQRRALTLGGDTGVVGGTRRVGAVAAFGLADAEVVLTRAAARELGAVPDTALLLAAPDVRTGVLQKAVERAAGGGVTVELLRPAEVAPSKVAKTGGRPSSWRELYVDSARYCPGLRWQVLAAIGQVESAHGKFLGPSSAGALGPMQFLPSTWAAYGVDGDGDGVRDIMSPFDAVPGAANYLCRSGANRGEEGLYDAIFAYNRADWYVKKVLGIAAQIQ